MGWVHTDKRYKDFNHGEAVRFYGLEGTVYKPGWFEMEREDIYVAVSLEGSGKIQRLHFETLEVEEPEPEPPAPEHRETNWYLCQKTGDLFYFSPAEGWYICVNNMVPPLHWSDDKEPRVRDLKRLYKEV